MNGSIFRVNRDVRFSKDKTPYKDHLDLWFWEGSRKEAVSGFYLRLTEDAVHIGVGAHGFDNARLARYRSKVSADGPRARLLAAESAIAAAGGTIDGETYKRTPRDHPSDDPDTVRLLKHSALWSGADHDIPGEVGSEAFVGWCIDRWAPLAPLHRWLVDEIQN